MTYSAALIEAFVTQNFAPFWGLSWILNSDITQFQLSIYSFLNAVTCVGGWKLDLVEVEVLVDVLDHVDQALGPLGLQLR